MKRTRMAVALALILCMTGMSFAAEANELSFFQAVIRGTFSPVKMQPVLVDNLLALSIPFHWEEVPCTDTSNMLMYQCTDDTVDAQLAITWVEEAEISYEALEEGCKELAYASCKTVKSGFEWQAFDCEQGIIVLHRGSNGRNYLLGLSCSDDQSVPDSAAARDFHAILHSLRLADDLTLSIWNSQQDGSNHAGSEVAFADPAFEAMLSEAAELEFGIPVSRELLEEVTSLFISRGRMSFYGFGGISSVNGEQAYDAVSLADLELFPNLTHLYVCDMAVTELEALQKCAQLNNLELIGCSLTSCEALRSLTQLERLSLARNDIVSLEPIAGMTGLMHLNLYCTPVEDLSALSGMTELRWLMATGTQITTLEALSGCLALEELNARDIEAVLSLKPLENLANLTQVDFTNTRVTDRESIAHVPNAMVGSW